MKFVKFSQILDFQEKSHIKAGDGLSAGNFPFFTSSPVISKYLNSSQFDLPSLIFGTGGSSSIHLCEKPFSVSTDCLVAQLKSNEISKFEIKFIYYYLSGNNWILEKGFKGSGLKHISKGYINNVDIPYLNIENQKRIVKILDKIDALRQKRKQAAGLLDGYLKSVFLEMFGDPKINPKQFPLVELQKLYIDPKNGTKCGPFGSALKKGEYVDNGIPVWNMDNISVSGQMVMPFRMWITPEKYHALEAYSVINGDVIISRAGTVGKMCVVRMSDEKSIISTNLIRVRFGNKLLPLYFVSLMNYCKGRIGRLKTGADGTFTHMNTGVLDALTFPYPALEIQNQFAGVAQKTEHIRQKMFAQSKELENQFQALMKKAFKGEL